MTSYDTLSEAISGLKAKGYQLDFNLAVDKIICHDTPISLMPNEFEIVELHRFEGDTDPADEAVLYAIESKHGHKGLLVNAYGMYADEVSQALVEKLGYGQ